MLSKHSTNRVVSLALSTILNINCRFLTIELTSASQLSLHKPPKDVPIRWAEDTSQVCNPVFRAAWQQNYNENANTQKSNLGN